MKVRNIALISLLLVGGCQKQAVTLDSNKILEEMLPLASGDMIILEEEQLRDILFIEDETVCVGATSSNGVPSEIILCKGNDSSVETLLDDRKKSYKDSAVMYSPETLEVIDDAIVEKTADLWMLILDENVEEIAEIAQNYTK